MGHQHAPKYNSTGWSDWDVDASHANVTKRQHCPVGLGRRHERDHSTKAAADNLPSPSHVATVRYGPAPTGKQDNRPHRTEEGHHHVGPTAIVPLQHHTPSDRVKSPDPDQTQAVSQLPPRHTTRGGLTTSTVGLHLTRRLASRGGLATPALALRIANPSPKSLPG